MHCSLLCFHFHSNPKDIKIIPTSYRRNLSLQRDSWGNTAFITEPELDFMWIFGFKLKFLYSPAAALMFPEFQDLECSQWVLRLLRQWQGIPAEGLSQKSTLEFPTRKGREQEDREGTECGFQCKGSWACRSESYTQGGLHRQLPDAQVREFRQNEKASCMGPARPWEKLKLCTLITWGVSSLPAGLGWGLRLPFNKLQSNAEWPYCEHHTQTPDNPDFKPQLCCLTGV